MFISIVDCVIMVNKIQIDLSRVEELASQGLTLVQISSALGVGETTFYDRKKCSKDFEEAIKKGKAKGIAHVTNKLRAQTDEGNTTATIFFLKTQAGWKETHPIEKESGMGVLKSLGNLFEERAD